MSEVDAWAPELRRSAGERLAALLRGAMPGVVAIAEGLAPEGTGPGVRLNVYEGRLVPRRTLRFQAAYARFDELLDALASGECGALELGLELGYRVDAEATVPVAADLLQRKPWSGLGIALGRALGASASEQAFELALAHAREPYMFRGVELSRYPGGVDRAIAALDAITGLDTPDFDPRSRDVAQALLTYLLRYDRERTVPRLVQLFGDPSRTLSIFAGRLLADGPDADADVVVAELSAPAPRPPAVRLAIEVLLRRDPARAIDALGGVDWLTSAEGRDRAGTLLEVVFRDHQDKKQGRTSHDWLPRDPRFADLAEHYRRDRGLKDLAAAILRESPARPKPAKKTERTRKPAQPPDAEVTARMRALCDKLERLVEYLRRDGYELVAGKHALRRATAGSRRALAKVERELGPLPATLRAFWDNIASIDLRGTHPRWASSEWQTDPLVVAAPDDLLDDLEDAVEDAPNALRFAPDRLGKAGYSAGTLCVWVPSDDADPLVEGGDVEERFSEHLTRAIAWAGFPGFATIEDRPEAWLAAAREAIGERVPPAAR